MADRTIKPDDTNDLVLQNNHGDSKIEVNEDDTVVVTSGGNFTVDATGDIILDADGADITLKDGGTTFGTLKQSSGDLAIQPASGEQIVLNDEGGDAVLTIKTNGDVNIKGDNFDSAYTDYYSSSTITGWSSLTATRRQIYYKKMGTIVSVIYHLEGTSNAITVSFTLLHNFITTDYMSFRSHNVWCYDNGSVDSSSGYIKIDSSTNVCEVYRGSGSWTASGTKIVTGSFTYATTP